MRVIVTGASSSIGNRICIFLRCKGWEVYPFEGRRHSHWRLGEPIPPWIEADLLIHLAHDRSQSVSESVTSVKTIRESFHGRIIFLSSMSAHSNSLSNYGKSKYLSEISLLDSNALCIRSGLIFGDDIKGFIMKLQNILRKFPVIPIPFSGKARIWVSHVDDLVEEIWLSLGSESRGVIIGASFQAITMATLFKGMIVSLGLKRVLIGIPSLVSRMIINALSLVRPTSEGLDSLKSLVNEISELEFNKLKRPTVSFRAFSPDATN